MNKAKAGTFILNKKEPIHGWYSYMEGYSSCLVQNELDLLIASGKEIENIYDPFGGTGTTPLVAAQRGINSCYSESNPFMQFVADTKINVVHSLKDKYQIDELMAFSEMCKSFVVQEYIDWDGFEKYFENEQLKWILTLKHNIQRVSDSDDKKILMLALSSIVVKASKMVRRGDLRYATDKEYKPENVQKLFTDKLNEIISDIIQYGSDVKKTTKMISEDARDNQEKDYFDCVITSPPYLNGTNYIRNTKLELKLNDYVNSEKELPAFHSKGIVAGINNVSKRSGVKEILPSVEPLMEKLQSAAYDERIPKMVAGYFYDMNEVINKLAQSMRKNGIFIMDIGDSQFGGIHIPTHEILSELCNNHGLIKYSEEVLRERKSKNGMVLSQRILRYKLEK